MKNAKVARVFHVFFDVTTMRDRNEFSRAAATDAGSRRISLRSPTPSRRPPAARPRQGPPAKPTLVKDTVRHITKCLSD